MAQWSLYSVLSFIALTSSLLDITAEPDFTSVLRLKYDSGNPNPSPPIRRTVVVVQDIDANIAYQTSLQILISMYNYQRNKVWYIEDGLEYLKKLMKFVDQQDKTANITGTLEFDPTKPQTATTIDAILNNVTRKFKMLEDALNLFPYVLTNLSKLVTLQERMIRIANEIDSNTRLMGTQKEIEKMERKLELKATTIVQTLTSMAAYSLKSDKVANITSKLQSLKSQIKPVQTLTKKFEADKRQVVSNILALKSSITTDYLDGLKQRTAKLANLYELNKAQMEEIIGLYNSSGDAPLNVSTSSQIKNLNDEFSSREKIIGSLEGGMDWNEKWLTTQNQKVQQLQDNLTKVVLGYRLSLVSNVIAHSALQIAAISILEQVKKAANPSDSASIGKLADMLKQHNTSIFELASKAKALNQPQETLKVDFSKYDKLLKSNAKTIASFKMILQQVNNASDFLQAIKFGAVNLTANYNQIAVTFPKILVTFEAGFAGSTAATRSAIMELQVILAQLEQLVVTEPLRRTLESFLLQQGQSLDARRNIFQASLPSTERSTLRTNVGPKPFTPLDIQTSPLSRSVMHM